MSVHCVISRIRIEENAAEQPTAKVCLFLLRFLLVSTQCTMPEPERLNVGKGLGDDESLCQLAMRFSARLAHFACLPVSTQPLRFIPLYSSHDRRFIPPCCTRWQVSCPGVHTQKLRMRLARSNIINVVVRVVFVGKESKSIGGRQL